MAALFFHDRAKQRAYSTRKWRYETLVEAASRRRAGGVGRLGHINGRRTAGRRSLLCEFAVVAGRALVGSSHHSMALDLLAILRWTLVAVIHSASPRGRSCRAVAFTTRVAMGACCRRSGNDKCDGAPPRSFSDHAADVQGVLQTVSPPAVPDARGARDYFVRRCWHR